MKHNKKSEDKSDERPWMSFHYCKMKCCAPECKECGWHFGEGHDKYAGKRALNCAPITEERKNEQR